MDTTSTVSTWTALIQQFFPVFTAPGAEIFLALVTGWVLCTGRHTLTGILPFADPVGQHAHDAFHRFLPDAHWDRDALWKLLTVLLVKLFAASGVVALDLDDTLFHRCGRKVCGAGWWRDAVRSTRTHTVSAWGLNLVVLTLRVTPPWGGEPLGLPILMRLHRKGGASLIALAEAMLQQVAGWLPDRAFRLHADGFYATLAGHGLVRVHLISRMRRDADLYEPLGATGGKRKAGRPRKKGRRRSTPQPMARRVRSWRSVTTVERGQLRKRWIYARRVLWYRVCKTPVLLVISRPRRQGTRRLLLHHGPVADPRTGHRGLRRSLEYRRHLQEHQTVPRRAGAADVEGTRPGAGGHAQLVVELGGMAVVSARGWPVGQGQNPALVSPESPSQFSGCVGEPSASPVEPANNIDVRQTTRT